jgi:uncharacterized membrane protein
MAITRNTVDVYRMSPARWTGLVVLALFLVSGGASHFLYTDDFTAIVPPWMPCPRETVLATGVLELLFAVLLFIKKVRPVISLWIAVYCLAVLPANIHMLQNNIPMFGHTLPPAVLYARIALQAGIIMLALWAANGKAHLVRYGLSGLFRG